MIYRIFKDGTHEKLDEVQDVNWPLNEKDAKLGVIIDGRETLCQVNEVSNPSIIPENRLVVDIYVVDLFPPSNLPTTRPPSKLTASGAYDTVQRQRL